MHYCAQNNGYCDITIPIVICLYKEAFRTHGKMPYKDMFENDRESVQVVQSYTRSHESWPDITANLHCHNSV